MWSRGSHPGTRSPSTWLPSPNPSPLPSEVLVPENQRLRLSRLNPHCRVRGETCPFRVRAQPDPMKYTSTASPQRAREEMRAESPSTAEDRNSTPYLSDRVNVQKKVQSIGQQQRGGGSERGGVRRADELPRASLSPDWTKAGRLRRRRPSLSKAPHRTSPFTVC